MRLMGRLVGTCAAICCLACPFVFAEVPESATFDVLMKEGEVATHLDSIEARFRIWRVSWNPEAELKAPSSTVVFVVSHCRIGRGIDEGFSQVWKPRYRRDLTPSISYWYLSPSEYVRIVGNAEQGARGVISDPKAIPRYSRKRLYTLIEEPLTYYGEQGALTEILRTVT
jgi:hypothetical protein